jgi:hypothetical protein
MLDSLWIGWRGCFGAPNVRVVVWDIADQLLQYGGSPVKVGDEEYSLFRDHE